MIEAVYAQAAPGAVDYLNSLIIPTVLIIGLILSIALMGLAASFIAQLLNKYRWIAYVGLLIILYVALKMMWEGWYEVEPFVVGALG